MTAVSTTKYVHQFRTVSGWDTVTNDDGTPSTFDTQAEADADMEIFFSEIEAAVARGDMDDHDRADCRVAELENNQYPQVPTCVYTGYRWSSWSAKSGENTNGRFYGYGFELPAWHQDRTQQQMGDDQRHDSDGRLYRMRPTLSGRAY